MARPAPVPFAPRLLILLGMALILASVVLKLPETETAVMQLVGGGIALVALGWMIFLMRRGRRG